MSVTTTKNQHEQVGPAFAWLTESDSVTRAAWLRTLALSIVSGALLWLSFPPLGWWPLAWIAPVGWLLLVQERNLAGRRPYLTLWIAGTVISMAVFYWIMLPHWALWFGWIALAMYLGVYLPVFIGLCRVAVHRLKFSVVIAAPVIWTGLELARGYLLSGLSMALLGHSQVELPVLIQISDLFGAYAVSFVVMMVAACLVRIVPWTDRRWTAWPGVVAVVMIGATLAYGSFRLNELAGNGEGVVARVALIQGSMDTIFDLSEEEHVERTNEAFKQYRDLTVEARANYPELDLVVWPESQFPRGEFIFEGDDEGLIPQQVRDNREHVMAAVRAAKGIAFGESVPRFQMLLGTQSVTWSETPPLRFYNSALLVDADGRVKNRYSKVHRVPFGEYIWFGDWFPWIYQLTPLSGSIAAGDRPTAMEVAGLRASPSICFESTVPHLIRSHINRLDREETPPDVLINITNDGWFWGSSCLDFHLACSCFRAVENRKPMLVAANTGLSAWIDGNGRVKQRGPRRASAVILAEVQPDGRSSLYRFWGDWPVAGCLGFCLFCLVVELRQRRSKPGDGDSRS